jgi:outer membrane murein-binding lipoprotein Lpp
LIEQLKHVRDNAANDPLTGGGNGGSGMEARVAKLEASVQHMERDIGELKADVRQIRADITGIRTTDFRLIFGAIITVALGLAGLMAKGFHWFN